MNLLRKLKISEIVEISFTETELEIIKLITDNFKDLTSKKHSEERIMYVKNSKNILMYIPDISILYVQIENFWNILQYTYQIKYDDIHELLIYMVNKQLKMDVRFIIPDIL